ncbi:hypothetical protein ACHWQZ_G010067 [Mnemiopsis leidyi]
MKIASFLCCLVSVVALQKDLQQILQSPKATLELYNGFKSLQGVQYNSLSEDRMRFTLFKKTAHFVAKANHQTADLANYEINFFATLTPEEQGAYLGLNATGKPVNQASLTSIEDEVPASVMWVNKGAVTPVKNQGSCSSSWSFAAVGAIETRYQQLSGRLRNLAEQEYLDCVYWFNGGCEGGWMSDAYDWSIEMDGTLSATSEYPYTGKDRWCKVSNTHNALRSHKIVRSRSVPAGEAANIAALAQGSLAVALEVTDHFKFYLSGILRDETCSGDVNHGAVAVGYTPEYILVKNSWSKVWGQEGFVKLARGHHNCGLFKHSSYPEFKETGKMDQGESDEATNFRVEDVLPEPTTPAPTTPDPTPEVTTLPPTPGPSPRPECINKATNCERDNLCQYPQLAETWCARYCGYCESEPTQEPNPEPNPNPTPDPQPLCYDKAVNCERDSLCDFPTLAETWCTKHCGYC